MAVVRVNPKQLKWARNLRNFSEVQAARALEISLQDLLALERGLKEPTVTIFRRLSTVYSVPEATLLLSQPPKTTPDALKDFRTRTVGGRQAKISPRTNIVISRIRSYQRNLEEISEADPAFDLPEVPKIQGLLGVDEAANAERTRIGVSIEDQLAWRSVEDAFRVWRRTIELQGICVYVEQFPIDDCSGVSILDNPCFPAIVLNKNERGRELAWVFSLIHEYAHILSGEPGLSDRNFQNNTEVFCNKFAAAFLIPRKAIEMLVGQLPGSPIEWGHEEVTMIARKLKVSQQATALRLETLGLAPAGYFSRYREQQRKKKESPRSGFALPAIKRLFALGRRFPSAIIGAADRGVIRPVDATLLLNAKITTVEAIKTNLGM